MDILSLNFFIFLIILLTTYYLIKKHQISLLIIFSIIFYTLSGIFNAIFLILFIAFDYFALKKIIILKKNKKLLFFILIFINLLPLLVTKYGGFISLNKYFSPPLGVSFITFIVVGNLLDIYQAKKITYSFFQFLFVNIFFPQITSGPISRGKNLLTQVDNFKEINSDVVFQGFNLILAGLFQKFVLANRLSLYVNAVFSDPVIFQGFPLLFAIYFFTFQIYLDFLSYTNIARGIAKLLGYDLSINFNYPYFSKSFTEFWRRWHISLSNWLRDYIYIPLGGSRVPLLFIFTNVLITFFISGLWHGSGWNFIIWGVINGLLIIIDRSLNLSKKIKNILENNIVGYFRIFITFNLIALLWVLFKAENFNKAVFIYKEVLLLKNYTFGLKDLFSNNELLENFELGLLVLIPYFMYEVISFSSNFFKGGLFKNTAFKYVIFLLLIFAFLFLGVFSKQNFYYAKF